MVRNYFGSLPRSAQVLAVNGGRRIAVPNSPSSIAWISGPDRPNLHSCELVGPAPSANDDRALPFRSDEAPAARPSGKVQLGGILTSKPM